MSHTDAEELLARRSELTRQEEARLDEHLAGCAQCRETADAYARQTALLRSLPLAAPPRALRAAVLSGIAERPRRRWAFRPLFALAPLGVVTAAVLAAVIIQHMPAGSSHNAALNPGPKSAPTAAATGATASPHPRKHPTRPVHHPTGRHRKTVHAGSAPPTATGSGVSVAVGPVTSSPYAPVNPPAPSGATGVNGAAPTPLPTARKAVLTAKSHPTQAAGTVASAAGSATVPVQPQPGGGRTGGATAPRPPSPAPHPSATSQPSVPTIVVLAPTLPTPPPTVAAPPPPVVVTSPSSPAPVPTPTP